MAIRGSYPAPSIIAIIALAFLSGCSSHDVPPVDCRLPDFQCQLDQALRGIVVVRDSIATLSQTHLCLQILIAISGTVATIMIALQGDSNKHWTRPIGLIATALVTALTSALVSFHVPDSIDKLIDIAENMAVITNSFDFNTEKLKAGRNKAEVAEAYKTDPTFRDAAIDIGRQFANDFNKLKLEMMRLKGTAAKLNSVPATPMAGDAPQPAKPKSS